MPFIIDDDESERAKALAYKTVLHEGPLRGHAALEEVADRLAAAVLGVNDVAVIDRVGAAFTLCTLLRKIGHVTTPEEFASELGKIIREALDAARAAGCGAAEGALLRAEPLAAKAEQYRRLLLEQVEAQRTLRLALETPPNALRKTLADECLMYQGRIKVLQAELDILKTELDLLRAYKARRTKLLEGVPYVRTEDTPAKGVMVKRVQVPKVGPDFECAVCGMKWGGLGLGQNCPNGCKR